MRLERMVSRREDGSQAGPTDNLEVQIVIVGVVFTFLATLGMLARIASIQMRRISWRSDDYILVVAYVKPPSVCVCSFDTDPFC